MISVGDQLAVLSPLSVHVAIVAPPTGVYPAEHLIVCISPPTKMVAALVSTPFEGVGIEAQDKTLNEQ